MSLMSGRARIVANIALLLALALAVLLAGCGGQELTLTPAAVSTPTATANPDPSPATPPTSAVAPTPSLTLAAPATPTATPTAKFQISSLAILPEQPVAGDQLTVMAEVLNVGNASGSYRAIFSVGDKEINAEEVTVPAGGEVSVSIIHVFESPGSAEVGIGDKRITVTVLKQAQLQVKSLAVTPPVVLPEREATVTAEVTNVGEVEGDFLVSMLVDGVEADNRPLLLKPGAIESVSFSVVKDTPGTYQISIGNLSTRMTVPELETYESEVFLYSISYPADWTLNVDEANPWYVGFEATGFRGQVIVNTSLAGTTVDEEYDAVIEATKNNISGYKVLTRTAVEEGGEVVGYSIEAEFPIVEGTVRQLALFTKEGSWSWFRSVDARDDLFEINKPLLQSILDSFVPPVMATGAYVNAEEGFAIELPPGWDGWETGEEVPFLVLESPFGEPSVILGVDVLQLEEMVSDEDIALFRSQNGPANFSNYRIVSRRSVALGPETQGYEIVFTGAQGGDVLKGKDVIVVRGTQAFAIWAVAEQSAFESQASEIEGLISSFTLREPMPFGVSRQDSLFLLGGTILTLDPALSEGSAAGHVGAIFSGLVALDRDLEVVPDLAERWEVSGGGTIFTFFLREGLQFHDGKPVTARDVKYSWERAAKPETDSPKALTFLGDIVGVKEKLEGEAEEVSGIEIVDDLTLRVTIDGPKPYFFQKLTYPTAYVVDRVNVQSGKTWTKRPNGTGPFKMKQWVEDELLILERNDLYYREVAKLAHVVYRLFAGRGLTLYEEGEIDITGVGLANIDRVLDPADSLNRELLVTSGLKFDLSTGYLAFNPNIPPFDDAKVRQAFALALDMDKWIEITLQGIPERASGILPPGLPGHNEGLTPFQFDPELAKHLIAESKYGGIDNLAPVTVYNMDDTFVAMWRDNLDIEVESIELEEPQEYYDLRGDRQIPLDDTGWIADYPDPQNFLEVLFHTDSKDNHVGYSNQEVDAALDLAAVERDTATRMAMYQDIEKTILEDWVFVPTVWSRDYVLVKPYVKGYFVAPMGIHILKDVSISR